MALSEARADIESAAIPGIARSRWCEAADLRAKTIAGAASATGLYLRAMRSDPLSAEIVNRAGPGSLRVRARSSRSCGGIWPSDRGLTLPAKRCARRSVTFAAFTRAPSDTPTVRAPSPMRATRSPRGRLAGRLAAGNRSNLLRRGASGREAALHGGQNTWGSPCLCQSASQSMSAATVM